MKRKTFKGGAHPYDGKKMSRDCPIEILNPGDTLVYPLSQHIGAMAKPLVKAGDRVLVGQKIAEKGGFISANIHSSVSGTVKAIEKRLVATGGMVDSIIVENDGMYEEAAPIFSGNPDELSKDEIIKIIDPQGGERSMIYAVTGRKINSKMLPADVGCIVHNVDTIYAIYNAVYNGKPLIERIVTITGDAVSTPKNFQVRIGTSFRELIDAAGGFTTEPEKIISGGPMMGFSFFNIDVPVVKGSSSLLAFIKDDVSHEEPSACIRCGRCAAACPEHLLPMKLAALAGQNEPEEFKKLGGMECVECGCCSYVCPAKRQVTQSVRSMKKLIIASARKK